MLSTKSDDDLDAESRELGRSIDTSLRREYDARGHSTSSVVISKPSTVLLQQEVYS